MDVDFYNIPEKTQVTDFDISWSHLKIILVSRNKSNSEQIEVLLTNILKSVDASDNQQHLIIDLEEFSAISHKLIQSSDRYLVIAFGLTPLDLKWQINYHAYEIIQIRNVDLVFTDLYEELAAQKSMKINLWDILKNYDFSK